MTWKLSVPAALLALFTFSCGSSSSSAGSHDGVGDDGGPLADGSHPGDAEATTDGGREASPEAAAPACAPTAASSLDAGPPNIPKGSAGCTRDTDCLAGKYCYAPRLACTDPTAVGFSAGDGTGGHPRDGGAACEPSLIFPKACEATALDWTESVNLSRDAHSLVESDTALAADGKGTVVAVWLTIPDPAASGVQQLNQLAVSHDDGVSFKRLTTPTDAATTATNDGVLAYDSNGLWSYVWEGLANDFKGDQHIWMSTSTTADQWSAAKQIDAAGDFQTGGTLDFPWIAVNPVNHQVYVSYEAAASNTNGSERLVVVGSAGGSLSLTDGARPNSYPDLARGAFDSSGSYHSAWMELTDQSTQVGGTLSGSTQNGIYYTRVDLSDGGAPTPLAHNVKVSGSGDAVNFDGPSIAVVPDGSFISVSYVVGTSDAVNVVVATSTDHGQNWSPAVKVNDDAPCATHFHSSLVLDEKGRLVVFWYDNRDGAGHFFYSVSDDHGKTFQPSRLVSAPSFPFDTFQFSTGWLGDYFEPAVAGGEVYVLWSDGREADQSHAFFAKAAVP